MRASALIFYLRSTKYDKIVVTEFVILSSKSYVSFREDAIIWDLNSVKV